MNRPPLSVADVIRKHGAALIAARRITSAQRAVLRDLVACRTSLLGGHVDVCDSCGVEKISYNSCRNRHCPTCLAHRSAEWLEERRAELLPVPYFHVVFTMPAAIAALALANKRAVYGLLFRAASKTLKVIARRHIRARVGGLMVLHTWNQKLDHHPHVHCVVPSGGLSPDGTRWIRGGSRFFLPVRILSRYFRGAFLRGLDRLRAAGKLAFGGSTAELADDQNYSLWRGRLTKTEWVVYAKRPFGSPERVLKYLAQYTHRVAISNYRLVSMRDGQVCFRYRDAKRGNSQRIMSLQGEEFLRRFLLHVHPKGFVRIRHFGFMANRDRTTRLAHCRELLGAAPFETTRGPAPEDLEELDTPDARPRVTCSACGSKHVARTLIPRPVSVRAVERVDTS